MEHKIKELENCKRELELELPYDELTPHFEKGLQKYRKNLIRPGFRKGKVPMHMISQTERDLAEYQTLEDIANDVFFEFIQENKVPLYGKGSIMDIDYKPKEKLILKYTYEIYEPITLDGLDKIELTKTKYTIEDSLVEEELDYLKLRSATFELDGQATDENYKLTIDTEELSPEGTPVEGHSNKGLTIFLNSDYLSKDYREGLKGIKENEERTIETENEKGEPVKLKITCTKVEKIIYPEMNEETFKKITGKDDIKTLDEMKAFIKGDLEKFYNNESERAFRQKAISEAIKTLDVKVPEVYTEEILNAYFESHKKEHKGHNHPIDEKDFKDKHRGEAIFTGKWFALKDEILHKEKFEITDDDYMKIAEKASAAYNIPADKLIEIYKNNPDVENDILNEKAIDFLISKAVVTETEETKKSIKQISEENKDKKKEKKTKKNEGE